jgi:hypothetical protein
VIRGRKSATRETDVEAPLEWQIATVSEIRRETAKEKSFTLRLPRWIRHRAGQHYDVRLTAPDGYQAVRSYSIASEPEREGEIDLTLEKIDGGEVSPYMHDVLVRGHTTGKPQHLRCSSSCLPESPPHVITASVLPPKEWITQAALMPRPPGDSRLEST